MDGSTIQLEMLWLLVVDVDEGSIAEIMEVFFLNYVLTASVVFRSVGLSAKCYFFWRVPGHWLLLHELININVLSS